jgi:hypothetical protein
MQARYPWCFEGGVILTILLCTGSLDLQQFAACTGRHILLQSQQITGLCSYLGLLLSLGGACEAHIMLKVASVNLLALELRHDCHK